MSLKDYRALIDIHGGDYIGIECNNGVDIEIGINGDAPLIASAETVRERIMPRMRERMDAMIEDGFKSYMFSFGNSSIKLNYYDAGQVLDALSGALRHIE